MNKSMKLIERLQYCQSGKGGYEYNYCRAGDSLVLKQNFIDLEQVNQQSMVNCYHLEQRNQL